MLFDIIGYFFIVAFAVLGIIVMLWGGLATIGTFVAVIGAIFEDLKSLSNLFKK